MKWRAWGMAVLAALVILPGLHTPPPTQPSSAPQGLMIWIELDQKRLTLYENGQAVQTFPIASGARDTPSPIGVFRVNRRFATELSGFGTRFLGLNVPWGQYGIHGTNAPASIGHRASHGCIRLRVRDAEALYRMVPNGATVVIEGGAFGPLASGLRVLKEGDRGADVQQLQRRLILGGWLHASADGVFGPATYRAVIAARRAFSLPEGDQADAALQGKLGMMLFE